jgi:DNA-3-methyladenine glycosylase
MKKLLGEKKILDRNFYNKPTLEVAQDLLGCFLVRKFGRQLYKAKIVETEAYVGEKDLACHASRGRTPRTEVMYGEPGHAYVYMIYGMYFCLNVVTENKDFPSAVLIRSVQVNGVVEKETNGPGKLCRYLKIDKKLNAWDLTREEKLWVEEGENIPKKLIKKYPRIGIDYAGKCKDYLWRFTISE